MSTPQNDKNARNRQYYSENRDAILEKRRQRSFHVEVVNELQPNGSYINEYGVDTRGLTKAQIYARNYHAKNKLKIREKHRESYHAAKGTTPKPRKAPTSIKPKVKSKAKTETVKAAPVKTKDSTEIKLEQYKPTKTQVKQRTTRRRLEDILLSKSLGLDLCDLA